MTILEVLEQVRELLRSKGRVSYNLLKTQFHLSSDDLAALQDELVEAEQVARDENGKVLVWVGNTEEDKGKRITDKGRKEDTEPQDPSRWTPAHLAERIRAVSLTEGERKTITALFADLKGSTALIEGLDPEEARAIIDPALQLMMDAVHRYEGYVAQALGDGIFALFGAPIAHEDHPQRALYAALRMQEEMHRYGDQVRLKHGVPLALRVGVNTGEVVVRSIRKDDLHTDYVPVGHSTNLAARIDRLAPDEKALLQQLAVIGREFPLSLIRQVIPQPEDELYRLLSSLQRKEFLYEQPAFPEVEYSFKHALTLEVAYNSVLIERRKTLHEQTGRTIEQLYHDQLEDHYSDLAHHYTHSGNTEKAIEYLHLAGQQAVQRSAYVEAVHHLTAALALLNTLPDTRERAQQELRLHLTLSAPLQATRSFASPEVKATYTRARELCQQVGETRQFFSVLFGLLIFHLVRGEFLTARELGEQLLGLAQKEQDPALLMEAYRAVGRTLFFLGEFGAAQAHLEQSLTLYDAQRHHSPVFLYGIEEPGIFGFSYVALVLWQLGYPDQALQKSEAALTLAQELSHPFSLAAARVFAAIWHQFRRERLLTQEWAGAGITLASEQGFSVWLGLGAVLQGWAWAEQGQSEEGISQIRHGMATYQAVGARIFQSYYLGLLAEAYGKAGQTEEGLAALAEALAMVDNTGERFYEAELYRLRGELTLQKFQVSGSTFQVETPHPTFRLPPPSGGNPQSEVEACFLKAIDIARKQQAKSLELRATTSLARLWQQQGKKAEAHQMLSAIYGWFTEGFDTKDLQEAKTLIEELRQQ